MPLWVRTSGSRSRCGARPSAGCRPAGA
jgi:hypothetical protein